MGIGVCMDQHKKVMVVMDESEGSYYSLMWVLENLGNSLMENPDSLVIFMAQPLFRSSSFPVSPSLGVAGLYLLASPTADFVNSRQEIEKKVAIGILEKAKSICTSRGVSAETILEEGDAKEAICNAVEKHNVSILVLAEQRLGRVKAAFTWSVSNYCVQYAKCTVLIVKNPEISTQGTLN